MTDILFTCYGIMHRHLLTKDAVFQTLRSGAGQGHAARETLRDTRVTACSRVQTHIDTYKNMKVTDFVDNSSVYIFCLTYNAPALFGRVVF